MDANVLREWEQEYGSKLKFNAGIDYDIERVIFAVFYEFDENQEPRFSIFCQVWKESKFGLIFCGRDSFRDLYELTTDILYRVKQYAKSSFKGKQNNILVRYAAIYMLYSIFFKQPCRPRVRIRLSYEEYLDLSELMAEAKRDLHSDIIYAWSKLILHHAFQYSVVPEHMGLEVAKTLERKEVEDITSQSSGGFLKSKEFKSMMRRLSKAHDNYVGIKKSLLKDSSLGFSLCSMDDNLMETINELTSDECRSKNEASARDDIGDKRKRLKEMYFSSGPEPERKRFKRPADDDDGGVDSDNDRSLDADFFPSAAVPTTKSSKGKGTSKKSNGKKPKKLKPKLKRRGKQ